MIACDVISTGSKGNAVLLNYWLLVDCGVPFKALAGAYPALRLVLLTHHPRRPLQPHYAGRAGA